MDVNNCFDEVKFNNGFDFNLKEQSEILNIILNEKKNVFVVLPTGFGKSLSFVLPPLLLARAYSMGSTFSDRPTCW